MSWEISPWISSRFVLKLSGEEERKEFLFVSVFNQRKILEWYSYQKQGDSECINVDLAGKKNHLINKWRQFCHSVKCRLYLLTRRKSCTTFDPYEIRNFLRSTCANFKRWRFTHLNCSVCSIWMRISVWSIENLILLVNKSSLELIENTANSRGIFNKITK